MREVAKGVSLFLRESMDIKIPSRHIEAVHEAFSLFVTFWEKFRLMTASVQVSWILWSLILLVTIWRYRQRRSYGSRARLLAVLAAFFYIALYVYRLGPEATCFGIATCYMLADNPRRALIFMWLPLMCELVHELSKSEVVVQESWLYGRGLAWVASWYFKQ